MRIAVITHYFPYPADPYAGNSSYQTLRVLADRHDVHVFVPLAVRPNLPGLRGEDKMEPHAAWHVPDVPVSYYPYTVLPLVSRPLNGFLAARKVLPAVRAFQPDIILNYVVYPNGHSAVLVGEELGVPVVLTAIGSDLNRIADSLSRKLTIQALKRASFVTTVSGDLALTAQKLGADPDTTKAILNGCDTAVFHPQDQQQARTALGLSYDAQIALYVGRLDLRKGLMELIEAAAILRKTHPRLHTYIMGYGEAEQTLQEAIAHNEVAGSVTILPSHPAAQVARWMAAADLMTLPSYNEGCPNVVSEALSAGRPIVATRVGGIPELMDERSGRLVPVKDVPALAQGIGEVLDATWNSAEIAARHARSWPDVAKDLEAVLEQTLAASRTRLAR